MQFMPAKLAAKMHDKNARWAFGLEVSQLENDTALELDDEEQPCIKCGGATDTGWECTECGFDNRDWYFPNRPKHQTE